MMKGIQKGSKQSFKEAVFFGIFEEWVELINSGLLFCFVLFAKANSWFTKRSSFTSSLFLEATRREYSAGHLQPQLSHRRGACSTPRRS
jgi:hypothetical protein